MCEIYAFEYITRRIDCAVVVFMKTIVILHEKTRRKEKHTMTQSARYARQQVPRKPSIFHKTARHHYNDRIGSFGGLNLSSRRNRGSAASFGHTQRLASVFEKIQKQRSEDADKDIERLNDQGIELTEIIV